MQHSLRGWPKTEEVVHALLQEGAAACCWAGALSALSLYTIVCTAAKLLIGAFCGWPGATEMGWLLASIATGIGLGYRAYQGETNRFGGGYGTAEATLLGAIALAFPAAVVFLLWGAFPAHTLPAVLQLALLQGGWGTAICLFFCSTALGGILLMLWWPGFLIFVGLLVDPDSARSRLLQQLKPRQPTALEQHRSYIRIRRETLKLCRSKKCQGH